MCDAGSKIHFYYHRDACNSRSVWDVQQSAENYRKKIRKAFEGNSFTGYPFDFIAGKRRVKIDYEHVPEGVNLFDDWKTFSP